MKRLIKRILRKLWPARPRSPSEEKDARIGENIRRFASGRDAGDRRTREADIVPEVLIPCYNQGRYLADALRSVRWGDGRISVTIINDASTDETAAIIEELSREHSFKLIENSTNQNQSGSLNRAIEESPSNFFIVLNADDCLMPFAIPTILGIFGRDREIRLLGGGCIPFHGQNMVDFAGALPGSLGYDPPLRRFAPEEARKFKSAGDIDMSMSGCSFFKSAWQASGRFYPFEERVCSFDDRDFQIRVACLFPVAVIEEPLAMWRQGSSLGLGRQ